RKMDRGVSCFDKGSGGNQDLHRVKRRQHQMCIRIRLNMFLIAPANTESLPLICEEHRKALKIEAMIATLILTGIALLITFAEMKSFIMVGSLIQVISIYPLTYKLLQWLYRNYEKYE
ncbi:accessory gene regulator B family protein, partial [Listeria monocytogenes]|uniref:accessory gene regulator B family protein n=1 Tax=Listeria monocytogenes TaxID=1639 RepID=UPI0014952229